jgi:hypothetical protein
VARLGEQISKAEYGRIHDDPSTMAAGCNVRIIKGLSGKNEIWVTTPDGLGMALKINKGKAGLGVTIRSFVGAPKLDAACSNGVLPESDSEIEIVQHYQTPGAQAFRAWYRHDITEYPNGWDTADFDPKG